MANSVIIAMIFLTFSFANIMVEGLENYQGEMRMSLKEEIKLELMEEMRREFVEEVESLAGGAGCQGQEQARRAAIRLLESETIPVLQHTALSVWHGWAK